MIIRTNTWHYKLYDFTYTLFSTPPVSTSLCQYVNRILWITPVVLAIMLVMLACSVVFGVLALIIKGILWPLAGYYPNKLNWDTPIAPWEGRYPGLPLGSRRIYPWHVILVAAMAWSQYAAFHYHWPNFLLVEALIVGATAFIAAMVAFLMWQPGSETVELVYSYLDAKKAKICPTVLFRDEEDSP